MIDAENRRPAPRADRRRISRRGWAMLAAAAAAAV
jgi:hypothetical protein